MRSNVNYRILSYTEISEKSTKNKTHPRSLPSASILSRQRGSVVGGQLSTAPVRAPGRCEGAVGKEQRGVLRQRDWPGRSGGGRGERRDARAGCRRRGPGR